MSLIAAALLAWAGWVLSAWLPAPAWAASQIPAAAVLLAVLFGDGYQWRRPRLPRPVAQPAEPEPRVPAQAPVTTATPVAVVVDLAAERERRRAA